MGTDTRPRCGKNNKVILTEERARQVAERTGMLAYRCYHPYDPDAEEHPRHFHVGHGKRRY